VLWSDERNHVAVRAPRRMAPKSVPPITRKSYRLPFPAFRLRSPCRCRTRFSRIPTKAAQSPTESKLTVDHPNRLTPESRPPPYGANRKGSDQTDCDAKKVTREPTTATNRKDRYARKGPPREKREIGLVREDLEPFDEQTNTGVRRQCASVNMKRSPTSIPNPGKHQ